MQQRCSGFTKSGARCTSFAGADGYCVAHSPGRVAQLADWRRAGGRSKSNRARARKRYAAECLSLREVQGLLSTVLKDLIEGEGEPATATAAASVARAIAAVAQVGDLEERIAELEAAAASGREIG